MSSFLIGLLGSGISASLSPALHERAARRAGLTYVYRRLDLTDDTLLLGDAAAVVRQARIWGFDGLNVTHPYKQQVLGEVDVLSPEAEILQAVNTIVIRERQLIGHNTDWSGFAASLQRGLPDARMDHVVVVGAGGAGSAVAFALATCGARRVTVVDVLVSHAEAVTARLAAHVEDCTFAASTVDKLSILLAEADGVVHATPVGMVGRAGVALPMEAVLPPLWVADVVYRPLRTELLIRSAAAGCRTLDGGAMAVLQAADSFRLFTGVEPDRAAMLDHLHELVAAEDLERRG